MRIAKHEMTKDPVVLKIIHELRVQGKTSRELEQYLNLKNGAVSRWKYLDSKGYVKFIDHIAGYLGISVESLYENESALSCDREQVQDITATEMRLVESYRKVNIKGRMFVEELLQNMAEMENYKISKREERLANG